MKTKPIVYAVRISLGYFVIGALYILFSDRLVFLFSDDLRFVTSIQTYKGLIFITLTAILLYLLIKKQLQKISYDFTVESSIKKALEQSEKRFRKLIENAPDGIAVLSVDGKFKYVSPSARNIFGYESDDTMDVNPDDSTHPEDLPKVLNAIRALVADPSLVLTVYYRFKHKNGNWIWIESTFSNLINEPGIEGIIINFRSVEERRKIEETLIQNEKLYRTLFDLSPSGVLVQDMNADIIDINDTYLNITGYNRDELIGQNIRTIVPAEYHSYIEPHIARIKSGERLINELYTLRKEGTKRVVELRETKVVLPSGEEGILVVANDITERKKFEEQLMFQANLLDEIGEAVTATDTKGIITYWNKAAEKLFGWTTDEVIGKNFLEIMASDKTPDIINTLLQGKSWSGELWVKRKDGSEFIASVNDAPIINNKNELLGVISILSDITEKKRAREELRIKNENLSKLLSITLNLTQSLDKKTVLHRIVEAGIELTGLDSGAIYTVKDQDLRLEATVPVLPANFPDEFRQAKLSEHPHIQKAIESRSMIITPDIRDEELSDKEKIIVRASNFISLIYLPLINEEVVNGILILGTINRKHILSESEISLCLTLSNLSALALTNSILFEKLNHNLTELKNVIIEKEITTTALRESEARFHSMFRNHNAIMFLIDPDSGNIIDANNAAADFYGYSIEVLRNMNLKTINTMPPEQIKASLDYTQRESGGYFNFNHRLSSGEIRQVEVYSTPIDVSGKVVLFSVIHDVTERRRAEIEIEESRKKMTALAKRIQDLREEERTAIARELHDELGQLLTAIKIDLQTISKYPPQQELLNDEIKPIINLVEESILSVRKLSSELRPNILDHLGLIESMEWQIAEHRRRLSTEFIFNKPESIGKLSMKKTVPVFRVFQEILTNIARHANASKVQVNVQINGSELNMTVADNGVGFNTEIIKNIKSLGIIGMQERLAIIGGKISFHSQSSKGTLVNVKVPNIYSDEVLTDA